MRADEKCLKEGHGNRGLLRIETRIISVNQKTFMYTKVKRVVGLINYAKIVKIPNMVSLFYMFPYG